MKRLAACVVEQITRGRNINRPGEKYRLGAIEGWSSAAVNFFLALVKLILGLMIGSVALLADAVHTASDISSSLAVLIGFRLSRKKPDRDHPFGHGRIEYFTGLVIALMLVAAGVSFIYTAAVNFMEGTVIQFSLPAIVVVLMSILIKQLMFHFSMQLGSLIQSEALVGDAWHHRSDALSSGAVLVALAGSYFNLNRLDAVLGFIVALLVIHAGLKIARNSFNQLLGTAPDPELKEEMIGCVRDVAGVIDAHDLEVHDYGFIKSVTVHIEVDGTLNVAQAHEIAAAVELQVSKSYYCSAVVHLDPVGAGGKSGAGQARVK